MNETVENLVKGLIDIINDLDNTCTITPNERALAMLDARSADEHIETLEKRIEDLEWAEDDYYVIEKDNLDKIMSDAMRKMFWNVNLYIQPEEHDYDNWVDDAIYELKEILEKKDERV